MKHKIARITDLFGIENDNVKVNDVVGIITLPNKFVHLRSNTQINLNKSNYEFINIYETGDRNEFKICDRCFKYKLTNEFENNRIKKGGLITKRPSCRDCRKIKNGIAISNKDRSLWDLKKPQPGDVFKCPICKKTSISGISKHVLDHNHKTGKVRGYLCESCNTGIGRFDDDVNITKNAMNWLIQKN
jgi:hypothetical protein